MCCFSVATPLTFVGRLFPPKVHVSKTNIFARMVAPGVQALAYGMNLETSRAVAMILPLPVRPGGGEDAVRFVSLEKHPKMFEDLAELFSPPMQPLARKGGFSLALSNAPKLVVHEVGAFVASYVPRREDFTRLDERFRLPKVLFDAVPHYADYGFAVFQLAPGKVTVHPMAMTFPTRTPDQLFFPTVHLHDGKFHREAKFDHALYYQAENANDEIGWMKPRESYEKLVIAEHAMARRTLHGKRANADTWIAAT